MAQFTKKFIVTAISATQVTLVPWIGMNSSGPVSGTEAAGNQDGAGQLATVIFTYTAVPTDVWKRVGSEAILDVGTVGA